MDKIEREISDRGYQSDSQIKENGSCHICNKSFRRIIEADCIKNEHENKDCDECGQTVCAECGSSVRLSDDEVKRRLLFFSLTKVYKYIDECLLRNS